MENTIYLKSHFKRNTTILISLIILVSIIVVVETFIYKKLQTQKIAELKTIGSFAILTPTPSQNTKYQNIAKSTLSCLDNSKDLRGVYLFAKNCTLDGKCQNLDGNQSGPRPIWAQYKYYQATKDPNRLDKINQDLIAHTIQLPTLQNDFWNCKLMFEMYDSHLFNEDQKKMIKSICLNSVNRPSTINEATQASIAYDSNQINTIFNNIVQNKIEEITPASLFVNNKLFETSYLSSEYVGIYNFQKNASDLKIGEYFFDQAFRKYIKNPKVNYQDSCTLGEASIDLFKATNIQIYLNLAQYIWQNQKIPIIVNDPNSLLRDKTSCAYFANDLYKNSLDINIKNTKNQILDSLISNNLDQKGSKHFINRDGCFDQIENDSVYKFPLENSLIIGLLLDN